MTELLTHVQGVPWLVAALVILAAVVWAVEKVAGLSGPLTALGRTWSNRELRKLRREALIRAERRRITAEEEAALVAHLRTEVADLAAEVARLRSTMRAAEDHHRAIHRWADGLLRAVRAAGVPYVDPPHTDERPVVESRNLAPALPVPR